jgi:hypothetical protein
MDDSKKYDAVGRADLYESVKVRWNIRFLGNPKTQDNWAFKSLALN